MRVLLTAHRFWPHVGGTEEVVQQLARRYAARGHDVTVATQREPHTPNLEEREGYRILRYDVRERAGFRFPPPAYRELVLREDWDVVHLQGQRVWSTDFVYRHLKRAKAPLVFTPHGFYQWHMNTAPGVNDLYYKVFLPRALKPFAAVNALTGGERDELLEWGVPSEKVHVIPDGLDLDEFREAPEEDFRRKYNLPADRPLLLYVGGFYPNKRVSVLVEAAARIPEATLAVIGKDASGERAACERLAKEKGADVRFLGLLPRDDVLAAYREAEVFLLASRFEGFGLVLLEAMASGLPFVATPAGAAPDLADHGAGLLASTADQMAESARALLDDEPRRRAMGEAGRKAVEAYDWDKIVDRYLELYEEVAR